MIAAGTVRLLSPAPQPRAAGGRPAATPQPTKPPERELRTAVPSRPTLRHRAVRVTGPGLVSWALLDRQTGRITGSRNLAARGHALAVIRPWLAADQLRRMAAGGHAPTQQRLRQLRAVLRGDGDAPADQLFRELGAAASIRRLIRLCRLADTRPAAGHWSSTPISARDTVRLGACLADGRAAGARWTPWLLGQLRSVRGAGDFGIRQVLPGPLAAGLAIRTGQLLRLPGPTWHVGCLAVDRDWVLGVLTRYPARLGLGHGKHSCRTVAHQLAGR